VTDGEVYDDDDDDDSDDDDDDDEEEESSYTLRVTAGKYSSRKQLSN
jgi:hypothetical protein